MQSDGDDVGKYIREVRMATQKFAKDLLWENEKLLALALTLNAAKISLEEQVALLRDEVDRRIEVHAVLVEQLTDAEESVRALSAGYVDAEQANSNLASLYAASCLLHGTLERGEVIVALKEIIINQIGSEEFAIFERHGGAFAVIASVGIDEGRALDAGAVEDIAGTGSIHVLSSSDAEAGYGPRLVIPLRVCGRVTGAIAIYRLLGHKDRLEWVDHELANFLAAHAGIALCASDMFRREEPREEGR